MVFVYNVIDSLPALAWLAKIEKDSSIISICCGNKVEITNSYFVAGVWDGDFNKGDFDTCRFSCCTGGKLTDIMGGVKFCTPIHLQESLFSIKTQNSLYVSNSLAFLLNESQCELDPFYKGYVSDMGSILYGYDSKKTVKSSPLLNNLTLNYHRCCVLYVNSVLETKEEIRKSGLTFKDFEDYKCKIFSVLDSLKHNALHVERKHRYQTISTVSRGYDAPSACVLAKRLGCREVVTFLEPKDDDGEEIATVLGYENIHKVNPNEYLSNKCYLEAEGAASGEGGATFLGLENLYKGKLFIMGSRGDSLFEKTHTNANDSLDFHVGNMLSQATLTPYENMLKNNSILVALPLIGGDKWTDLAAISKSKDMAQWSIGGNYDRPIPRRLLEEEGVKRELFGQAKKGAGVSFSLDTLSRLRFKMSPSSYESLIAFRKTFRKSLWRDLLYKVKFYFVNFPIYANFVLGKFGCKKYLPYKSDRVGMLSNPNATMMLCWGIDKVRNRYKY